MADTEGDFTEIVDKKHKKRKMDEMDVDGDDSEQLTVRFKPIDAQEKGVPTLTTGKGEIRRIPVPPHRYTPLRENWLSLFKPLVEHLKLQVRFNTKIRNVELRCSTDSGDKTNLQKGADFVKAFLMGFDLDDSLALLRLDELFLESFEVEDVKPLKGDHLSRAIGRIAGKGGRTKFTIENVTKTRIVLADNKIHILGSFQNIRAARTAVCNLILGSPPSKVYGSLRQLSSRVNERF